MNSKCFCFKQSNNHRLCLPKYNSQHTFFWCLQSVKSAQSLSLSLALYKTTCIHYFSRVSVYASQYVRRLGQLVPLNVIRLHTVLYEVQIAVIKCWNTTWEGANSWTLWSQTHLDKQQQVWGRGGGGKKWSENGTVWSALKGAPDCVQSMVLSPPFCLPPFKLLRYQKLTGIVRD